MQTTGDYGNMLVTKAITWTFSVQHHIPLPDQSQQATSINHLQTSQGKSIFYLATSGYKMVKDWSLGQRDWGFSNQFQSGNRHQLSATTHRGLANFPQQPTAF